MTDENFNVRFYTQSSNSGVYFVVWGTKIMYSNDTTRSLLKLFTKKTWRIPIHYLQSPTIRNTFSASCMLIYCPLKSLFNT